MAKGQKGADIPEPVASTVDSATSGGDAVRKPVLAQGVVVITPVKILGRNEHAAIVTAVETDDVVSVLLMPAGVDPYPIRSVPSVSTAAAGALRWRWP